MRLLSSLITLAILGSGLWWVDQQYPDLKNNVLEKIPTRTFSTLEARYTPKQILEMHKSELESSNKHKRQSPELKLAPYLLLEVKYSKNSSETKEGIVLWDLADGEMVLNTKTWEKSHGYGDCINSHANANDFKVINVLAHKQNADHHFLAKTLSDNHLENWLESAKRKKLIVQNGSFYRLHMQNASFAKIPETTLSIPLATTIVRIATRQPKRFSAAQIKKIATLAFGSDFTIKSATETFLPFYSITVTNSDGTHHTTYWNAVTGKRLSTPLTLSK